MEEKPRIPGIADCLQLMQDYAMLANIRRHSLVVARLAIQLLQGLRDMQPGKPQADMNLVLAGALLHDIAKPPASTPSVTMPRSGLISA